jgi:hypothetical protein
MFDTFLFYRGVFMVDTFLFYRGLLC